MFDYIEQKRIIADNLADCGHVVSDTDLMLSILHGLNTDYQTFKSTFNLNPLTISLVLYNKQKHRCAD